MPGGLTGQTGQPTVIRVAGALACAVLVAAATSSGRSDPAPGATRCAALLDLVIFGYDDAVSGEGAIVSPDELADQRAIAAAALVELRGLGAEDLVSQAKELEGRVGAAQAPAQVVYLARKLQDRVSREFAIALLPTRAPDRDRGATLYRQSCAACHGADGRPSRELRRRLVPPPPALADRRATGRVSVRQIYSAATVGVPQTPMPGFAEALTDDERWDLAFYARSLAHATPASRGKRALERAHAGGFAAGIAQLAHQSDDYLRLQLRATSLSSAEVERALAAVRHGPFPWLGDPGTSPAIILPAHLLRARVFSDRVDAGGQQGLEVETRLLLLEKARAERRARVDEVMNVVVQQLLWRSGRPPASLTLSLYANEADASAGREPIAFCVLESEDDVDCENRIPLSFAEQLAHGLSGRKPPPDIAADERLHSATVRVRWPEPGTARLAEPPSFESLARAFFEDALRLYQQAPDLAALTYVAVWKGRSLFEVRLRDRAQLDLLGFPVLQQRIEGAPEETRGRLAADGYRQALSLLPPGSVRLGPPLRAPLSGSTPRGSSRARCHSCR